MQAWNVRRIGSVVVAAAALVTIASVSGCGKSDAAAGPPSMPPPAVVTVDAKSQDVPVYLDEIGKATALESVNITPRIAGQIIARKFEDGADVKKGQVLFEIDPAPTEAALESAKANVAQQKAALDFANIELNRYAQVAGTNAISKSDYDTKVNAVDVAKAQLAFAQAQVATAQINLDFCTIRSPIDGRAGSRMVDVGNVVKENETALLSVQTISPIYADFTVNEQELAAVRGNMAGGTLKTLVMLPTDGANGREGQLTFLDNSVQNATGTVRVRATIPNQDLHFWPGQFVNVRLVLKTLKDAVLVPNTATQVSQQGLFVFVVHDDDKSPTKFSVAQTPIQVGQRQGDMVVISDGVKQGDKVVTAGQMLLQGGMPVTVLPPGGGAPGGPGGPGGDMPGKDGAKKGDAAASAASDNTRKDGSRS